LPIIRISRNLDPFVGLELDQFERAGADRLAAHFARRHMAGVDGGPAGRQQRDKGRLRPLQTEGDLVVALDGHLVEVLVPGLARIEAKFLVRFAEQSIPGALYIVDGKWLSVMPFDTVMEAEAQLGLRSVPRPPARKLRHARGH